MLKKITSLISWTVTTALLVCGVGLLAVTVPAFGNQALIVRSGSMVPAINVGDLIVARPQAAEYKPGQIISYRVPGKDSLVVTHRVVNVSFGEGKVAYYTKGDANNEADGYAVPADRVIGRQLVTVPYIGHLLAFAKSRIGFLALVIVPSMLVILGEGRVIVRELKRQRRQLAPAAAPSSGLINTLPLTPAYAYIPRLPAEAALPPIPRHQRRLVFVDSVARRLAVLVVGVSIMVPSTFALVSDSGASANNTFIAAEDFGVSAGDVVINEVMWMGSTLNVNDEWLELRNLTSDPVDITDWTIVNAGAGGSPIVVLAGTIPGDGYFLLSNFGSDHPQSELNNGITVDQQESNLSFVNDGEQLTLKDSLNNTIDQTPVGSWPAGLHDTENDIEKSMSRNDPPSDGTVDGNWHTCTDLGCNDGTYWDTADGNNFGTPKAANL